MSAEPGPGRKAIFAYAAGQVRRWHAAGHVIRQQNVMEHSGGVALWISLFHPDPSARLLKAALVHDLGEIGTGDMPRWAKQRNPDINLILSRVEEQILIKYGLNHWIPMLEKDDENWLHSADVFDAWMFMFHNLLGGNYMLQGDLNKATRVMHDWNQEGKLHDNLWIAVKQIRALYPWVYIY